MSSKRFNKEEWKKQRKIERLAQIENKYFIFCEGEQTEPNYFNGFKRYIERSSVYKNLVLIEVKGVGADTERVINYAINYVNENKIKNAKIWCVYDKDSFPPETFNRVAEIAGNLNSSQKNVEYHIAWSNQCIEYWFILHFNYYDADNDRQYYKDNLNPNFRAKELPVYRKNDAEIFEKLTTQGDPKLAVRFARRRIGECCGRSHADSSPATMVFELVEELAKFLPEDMRERYI